MQPTPSAQGRSGGRSVLAVVGLAIAIGAALAGLVAVGFFVVLMVGMSHWGSNK